MEEVNLNNGKKLNASNSNTVLEEKLSDTEKSYMEVAFQFAYKALEVQEVPVGCIFVYNNEIIARGRNTVNETRNATRHAEMNCVDEVSNFCKSNDLNVLDVFKKVSVYVTVEPCIMCSAALYELKTECIVYGCKNDRFGGQTVFDVSSVLNPCTIVKSGYRAGEALSLLKEFYKGTNPSAPVSKAKAKKGRKPSEDSGSSGVCFIKKDF